VAVIRRRLNLPPAGRHAAAAMGDDSPLHRPDAHDRVGFTRVLAAARPDYESVEWTSYSAISGVLRPSSLARRVWRNDSG